MGCVQPQNMHYHLAKVNWPQNEKRKKWDGVRVRGAVNFNTYYAGPLRRFQGGLDYSSGIP